MSFFSGSLFFIFLIPALVPAVLLGLLGKPLRTYRNLLTVAMILLVYLPAPVQLLYLILYCVLALLLTTLFLSHRKKKGREPKVFYAALFLALLPLIVCKCAAVFEVSVFGFLGISYLCFRVLIVLIEIHDGVITSVSPAGLLSYLLFFTSLSSGPIDRPRRFEMDDTAVFSREEYTELLYRGIYRIVLGAFYKFVCSEAMYYVLHTYIDGYQSPPYLVAYAYVYGLYLFFDFAGYSAMATGTSYLLGIRMPDNFNRPFLAVDLRDFWNRWHITLSSFFRDFVFTRFMIFAARKKAAGSRLQRASAGLILNMFLMGLWHGISIHYVLYGLYHGILLAVTEVFQKKSSFYKRNRQKPWYIACSWLLNLNIVMLGFLIFSGYLSEVWKELMH